MRGRTEENRWGTEGNENSVKKTKKATDNEGNEQENGVRMWMKMRNRKMRRRRRIDENKWEREGYGNRE